MQILVFEYITGGGFAKEPMPHSLAREGDLMLQALLDDLTEVDGNRLMVMRDARLEPPRTRILHGGLEWIQVGAADDLDAVWKSAIRNVDAVWPIAPETGGVLERLCREVRAEGRILLNSPAEAVALTASKLKTLTHLSRCGVDIVPTIGLADFCAQFRGPWVVKPDDGAGCGHTRIIRTRQDLKRLQEIPPAENFIVQPYLEGTAMSLSLLFKQGKAFLLSCNRQHIDIFNDAISLAGCTVNIAPQDRTAFSELAGSIGRAIPELFGYAGVDLVLVDGRPKVLEVNPRLTTSYAVLSTALQQNVAALVLELLGTYARLPAPIRCGGRSVEILLEESHDF
jgi:tyramine---L-glutamate ligase